MQLKKKKSTHNRRKKSEGSRMWASFFLINGDCSSNPDCMRRMNTQSTAAALQATLSFVLTIQMSSRAWRTLQKQRRARGAWLQSGSTFFFDLSWISLALLSCNDVMSTSIHDPISAVSTLWIKEVMTLEQAQSLPPLTACVHLGEQGDGRPSVLYVYV